MGLVVKIPKKFLIFAFIMLQTTAAITCGFFGLYFAVGDKVPPGIYVEGIKIGGLKQENAVKLLHETTDGDFKEKSIHIRFGNNTDYEIGYAEIGAAIDPYATVSKVFGDGMSSSFSNIIKGYFSPGRKIISPVLSFDEHKLSEKLRSLSLLVDREAMDATVSLREDTLVKVPEVNGLKLDIGKAAVRISESLASGSDTPIELTTDDSGEIDVIYPEYTERDFDGVEEIIARYTTDIKTPGDAESIKLALSAINRVLVYPFDPDREDTGIFSFNKYLGMANAIMEKNNEGYNQVASTLYATVLIAGISPDSVTRSHHTAFVDYIEPGLDTMVFGNTVDFKFQNTMEQPVVIFANVRDGKVIVTLVGKKKDSSMINSLKIDIEQRYTPPVIYTESKDIEPGRKELVSAGREGLKLSVYLVVSSDGTEAGRTLVETCEYRAVESVVQIGPDTGWGGSSDK